MTDIESKEMSNYLFVLNQLFEIERKSKQVNLQRHIDKLKNHFAHNLLGNDSGLTMHNLQGEPYDHSRTDCEASIAGNASGALKITEVIKPLIRLNTGNTTQIVQKAVVIVESEDNSQ